MTIARLGGIKVGQNRPVIIMGVVNMSPESFYGGSIAKNPDDALKRASTMIEQGAKIIDVGGMSTAPYKATEISVEEEVLRVVPVIKRLKKELGCVISVDTTRAEVAENSFRAGAQILNDVTGLKGDSKMAKVAHDYSVSAILAARETSAGSGPPLFRVLRSLKESILLAVEAGLRRENIVIDPGIGFFRNTGIDWYDWDVDVLSNLFALRVLDRPILVAVSRKSFIGKITSVANPEERLYGSLAAESVAVALGADIVRTHNVSESLQAAQVARKLRPEILERIGPNTRKKIPAVMEIQSHHWKKSLAEVGKHAGEGATRMVLISGIDRQIHELIKSSVGQKGGEFISEPESLTSLVMLADRRQIESLIHKAGAEKGNRICSVLDQLKTIYDIS
ncbi:MAG: dihydropteroate synthase [Nitrososphaerota archaeon]|jgi:dihydropteroate synthase|nr:dihydropteroate synthase [Nitrososphaerota archaeon]